MHRETRLAQSYTGCAFSHEKESQNIQLIKVRALRVRALRARTPIQPTLDEQVHIRLHE